MSSPPTLSRKPLLRRSVPRPVAAAVFGLLVLFVPAALYVRATLDEARRSEAYLPELEADAKQNPANARIWAMLGGRYVEAGAFARASTALQQAIGAGLSDAVLFETWAAAEAANGDTKKAVAALQYGIQTGRCQPLEACRAALNRLQTARAQPSATPISLARAISPGGTGQITARYGAGAGWASSFVGDSFTQREENARLHPDDLTAQLRWGEALHRNRHNRDAESIALGLVDRYPKSVEAHVLLGDVFFDGGLKAKAGIQYKAALALQPNNVSALKGLGNVGIELKLLRVAIDNYEKVVKIAPNDADSWIGLGRAYLNEQFRFDRSVDAFATAARLAPERTDFFPYYSDALGAMYKIDEAEQLLRRRLRAEPDDARSHFLLARILLKNAPSSARTAEAEEHLRTSLKLEPNAPAVRVALAQILLDKGDSDSAADAGILLSQANEQDPLDPLAVRLLATAYRRIGRPDRAKEADIRARELATYKARVDALEDRERVSPRDIKVHQDLAALYKSGGEDAKASRQSEMAAMLLQHPREAGAGITALVKAVTKTGQVDKDIRK